jgi:hypothetical protein
MTTVDTKKKRGKKTATASESEPVAAPVPEPAPSPAPEPKPKATKKAPAKSKSKKEIVQTIEEVPVATATSVVTKKKKGSASAAPGLFVEGTDMQPIPSPAKKGRKPPIVASVTPEGIHGSLQNNDQRPLIAHLPIHGSDIDSELFCNLTSQKEEKSGMPNPFDPEDVYSTFDQENVQPLQIEKEEAKPAPPKISSLGRPSLPIHYSEKLMIRYQDSNREQRIPDSTDIVCFWDCQPFRTQPCVIPTTIEEGIWRVYGNFCSPECAAAFLFHERLDSHAQWERYALLNRLYSTEEMNDIRLAPPRHTLRLFGGIMDVSEFRDIVKEKRMRIDVMTPPMISIIQVMDTKPIDFYDASMKNTFIPWEMDRMNRPGAQGLRLQRSKPVVEKESTLEFCMGLTAKS